MNYTISSLDFAAICGLSPYDSPVSLFLKKQGKIPKEVNETFHMKLGKKMEKIHRELLTERGIVSVSGDFNLRKKPGKESFIAVPDGFCNYESETMVIENKTCLHGYINEPFFETQLRWEMYVCEMNGVLTVLTPNDIYITTYYRDEEWEREAESLAQQFIEMLENDIMPDVSNYHKATFEALKQIKREKEEPIIIGSEYEPIFKKIEECEKEIKRNEEAIEMLKSQLLAMMGDHKEGTCGSYNIKMISYEKKPSITVSEVNDEVIKSLNELKVKYKLNEKSIVNRLTIKNLTK